MTKVEAIDTVVAALHEYHRSDCHTEEHTEELKRRLISIINQLETVDRSTTQTLELLSLLPGVRIILFSDRSWRAERSMSSDRLIRLGGNVGAHTLHHWLEQQVETQIESISLPLTVVRTMAKRTHSPDKVEAAIAVACSDALKKQSAVS